MLQLVNATDPSGFTPRDSSAAEEIAGTLAIALFNQRRARSASRTSSPWRVLVERNRISEDQLTEAAASRSVFRIVYINVAINTIHITMN